MPNISALNQSILRFPGPPELPVFYPNVGLRHGDENCSRELDFLFWIINGVIGVFILCGNTVTCAAFLRFQNLRRSYMNLLLLSLAICDVLMAVTVTPGYAAFCTGCRYGFSKLCWVFEGGKDICFLSSTFNLLAISYDRQLAIFQPLKYQTKMSRKKIRYILSAVWIGPICLTSDRKSVV